MCTLYVSNSNQCTFPETRWWPCKINFISQTTSFPKIYHLGFLGFLEHARSTKVRFQSRVLHNLKFQRLAINYCLHCNRWASLIIVDFNKKYHHRPQTKKWTRLGMIYFKSTGLPLYLISYSGDHKIKKFGAEITSYSRQQPSQVQLFS